MSASSGVDGLKRGDSWQEIAQAERIRTGLVWHYTDAKGLLGILQERTMFASLASMLNDEAEVIHGMNQLRRACRRHQERDQLTNEDVEYLDSVLSAAEDLIGTGCFTACASLGGDLLSSWRGYAGEGGFAIGLDPRAPLAVLADEETELQHAANRANGWHRVVYNAEDKAALADEAIRVCLLHKPAAETPLPRPSWAPAVEDPAVISSVLLTAINMKHDGFEDEREARIFYLADRLTAANGAIKYRPSRLGVVPYLRLTGQASNPADQFGIIRAATRIVTASQPEKLPVRAINVGPSRYPEASKTGLLHLLAQCGYASGEVAVGATNVPYR